MARRKCEPPCIHPDDLIGAAGIRTLAAGQGRGSRSKRGNPINRRTLAAWREDGFPEPIKVLDGAGPGGTDVELWDRRAVREWLKARRTGR